MSKEAMKLALEALLWANNEINEWRDEAHGYTPEDQPVIMSAITALQEALAEPQEKYQYGTPLLDAMRGKANEALDRMAENARELGLDYEPAQQEPVAKKTRIGLVTSSGWDSLPVGTEFYTSQPAQRTWVGLTDEEVEAVWKRVQANDFHDCVQPFARAIEAKLKEKNNGNTLRTRCTGYTY